MATTTDESVAGIGARARWSRLAALGLFLAALGPLLMFAAGLLWGLDISDEAGFFLITGGAALVGSFLVWRYGFWAKVVGILVALAVAVMLFWTAFGLFTPMSVFDFMPGVLVIPGALLAVVSCIAAMVAGRRGHMTPVADGGERTGIRVAVGIVVLLAVLSTGLTFASRSSAEGASGATTVTAFNFEFDQDEYTVEGGSEILVVNEDPFLHTFTVEDLDIDVSLSPGSEETVVIPSEPGRYVAYCRPHTFDPKNPSDDDMATTLVVN